MEEIRSLKVWSFPDHLNFSGWHRFIPSQTNDFGKDPSCHTLPAIRCGSALGPNGNGTWRNYFYTVDFKAGAQSPDIPNDRSEQLMELKRIHDLLIKPRLRSVPGVAEINTIGGKERQLLVLASPEKLAEQAFLFREIRDVVAENTENAGGGILSLGGEQVNVRANTRVNQPEEVATLAVKTGPGVTALRLSEVAEVQTGSSVRVGAATWNGREALLGTVMMLAGENPRVVARNVEAQILEISPPYRLAWKFAYYLTALIWWTARLLQSAIISPKAPSLLL